MTSFTGSFVEVAGGAVAGIADFKLTVAEILNTDVEDWTASSLGGYIDAIKKYVANRLVVSSGNYTLYKDDEATVFETGTTSASGRDPS